MNLKLIKDIHDNNYFVVDVNTYDDDSNGKCFVKIILDFNLKVENANVFNKKLLKRNNKKYHITVFNVPEYDKVKNKFNDGKIPENIPVNDIKFKGIGSIEKNNMLTYFVVVESETLNKIRELVNLKPKDFHITIGFTDKDLFHDRKNNPNIIKY